MLEVARHRCTWSVEVDGDVAKVHVRAEPAKAVKALKGILLDSGRAKVLVGFGEHEEDATYHALNVPDAHDLVSMLHRALDAPLPRRRTL
jgi:hypothetical protein